jgi:hypothetical protein
VKKAPWGFSLRRFFYKTAVEESLFRVVFCEDGTRRAKGSLLLFSEKIDEFLKAPAAF